MKLGHSPQLLEDTFGVPAEVREIAIEEVRRACRGPTYPLPSWPETSSASKSRKELALKPKMRQACRNSTFEWGMSKGPTLPRTRERRG